MDFSKLKQNREAKTAKLIESLNKKPSYQNQSDDTRFWKPTMDAEKGVGGAVIRFLPAKGEDVLDYAMYYQYSFKWAETNQWYIEKSLWTLQKVDPVYELRARLYATKTDTDKKLAELMRLNKNYIANIEVINDPAHPEFNGKTFLYRYPATVASMIESSLQPVADPLTGKCAAAMDAFDVVDGANLELRISSTKNGWNYDKTTWATPSPAGKTVEEIEAKLAAVYELGEFTAPDTFKTYEQLQTRLVKVLGTQYIGTGVLVTDKPVAGQQVDAPREQVPAAAAPVQRAAPASSAPRADFDNDLPPFDTAPEAGSKSPEDMFADLMAGV